MSNEYPITALELSDELANEFQQYGIDSVVQLIELYREYRVRFCEYLKGRFEHLTIEINELCQQLSEILFSYEQNEEVPDATSNFSSYRLAKKGMTPYKVKLANHLVLDDEIPTTPRLKRLGFLAHLNLSTTTEVVLACLQSQFNPISNDIDDDQALLIQTSCSNVNGFNKWSDSNDNVIQNNLVPNFDHLLSFTSSNSTVPFIKEALSGLIYPKSKLVLIDLPIYNWFYHYVHNSEQLPLPFEKLSGHYPIVITGYKNNESSLGGGYFYVQLMFDGEFIDIKLPYAYLASISLPICMIQSTYDVDLTTTTSRNNANQVLHLGHEIDKKSSLYLHTPSSDNEHILIVGRSGCGKSELVKNISYQRKLISPTDPHHLFDVHNEYKCLEPSKTIDVLKSGFPYSILSNPRKQPQWYFIDNLLSDSVAACPMLGSNQQALWRDILNEGYEARWNNYQLADALVSCKSKTLVNQLSSILNLLRADRKQTLDFDKQQGLIIHNFEHIDNPDTRGAYLVFMLSRLMDHKIKNGDRYKLYLTFEEASRLKKANRQLELLFCGSRKFGVSACFIDQQMSTVPLFVKENTATVINFNPESKGSPKGSDRLSRHQAIIKSQYVSKVIKTVPFVTENAIKGLTFKPQPVLVNLLEASKESKLIQSFQRIRQWFD